MRTSEEYATINQFTSETPVDVINMIRALGVEYHEAYLEDDISGMLERRPSGRFRITVNAAHPRTRRRFTAAHELGHYMRHRSLVGDGVDDNRAYRSTDGGKYHNTNIGPAEETEANQFAASVLMPGSQIYHAYQSETDPDFLADKFGVSRASMRWRLLNLGFASKAELGL